MEIILRQNRNGFFVLDVYNQSRQRFRFTTLIDEHVIGKEIISTSLSDMPESIIDTLLANVSYGTATIGLPGGLHIAVLDLMIFGISVITIAALTVFLRKTYTGRAIRATSDDTAAASLMGVNVQRTYAIAMGVAMVTAAVAGLAVGMKWVFYPSSGGSYLLIAFGVVVIGGMGSIPGTLVAGLVFGLAQVFGGANYGMLVSYVVLIIMLALRPKGLFSK